MNIKVENIKKNFADYKSISTGDFYEFYQEFEPTVKKSTVNWRIYELVKKKILQRIGRGRFVVGLPNNYLPEISDKEKKLHIIIKNGFPFIKYCIWNSSNLTEFFHHQTSFQFIVVEVERDALDAVYLRLKEENKFVSKNPSKEQIEDSIATSEQSIILIPFVSEAPIQIIDKIPTTSIEKLLVDLYSNKKLFYYLQGNELVNIYKNAFNKYTINQSKMLRYASRRQKKKQITKIINLQFGSVPKT